PLNLTSANPDMLADLPPRADGLVLGPASLPELVYRETLELRHVANERGAQMARGQVPIHVGAALRLRHDLVADAEPEEVSSGQLECLRGLLLVLGGAPEDRGAPFGGDDRVDGVLEHEDPVGDADAERAAGHPFADHRGDDGNAQPGHLAQVEGDGLADPTLLGSEAGIRARGVDEGDDGAAELLRLPHEPERLPVPLGVRHAEVAPQVLLHVPALLLPDDHDGARAEARPAADDRLIVAEVPV